MDLKESPAFEAVGHLVGSDLIYPCHTQIQGVQRAKSVIVHVSNDVFLIFLVFSDILDFPKLLGTVW